MINITQDFWLHVASLSYLGVILHFVADWMFQNDWMAVNKTSLKHPAAWVHSGIHFVFMLLIFPWWAALIVAGIHILIDTRKPLQWWAKKMGGPLDGNPMKDHVSIWRDQVLHMIVITLVAILFIYTKGGV